MTDTPDLKKLMLHLARAEGLLSTIATYGAAHRQALKEVSAAIAIIVGESVSETEIQPAETEYEALPALSFGYGGGGFGGCTSPSLMGLGT